MIMLTTLLISIIVLIAAIVCLFVFKLGNSKGFVKFTVWMFVVSLLLGGFCGFYSALMNNKIADMRDAYKDIMIYDNVIQSTLDESARFGHYEKVKAFNNNYLLMERCSKSAWTGKLILKNWNENMNYVDFYFLNVEYAGVDEKPVDTEEIIDGEG
jgi:RsiW-degrading membrane proteinase PrsW (M82 family)